MNRIWKFILSLVILETTLLIMIYCYSWFSNNSIELSNIRKREENLILDDIKNKSTFETNVHGKGNINASAFLAYFKKGLSVVTENSNKIQRHNDKLQKKVSSKRRVKSIMSPILIYKGRSKRKGYDDNLKDAKFRLRNRWNTNNGSGTPSGDIMSIAQKVNKIQCTFSFDQKSLMEAKKNLTKSFYLFYINLTINDINHLNLNETEQDQLIHWQYVRKSEKFLVQLPVDFDLLTYNLLVIDKEETVLNIKVDYNHSTCTQEFQDQVKSIRSLLWNKLFDHNTTFYLCNRNFTNSTKRNVLYYITTIWVGYDLSCSKASSNGSIEETSLEKDHLPLVTPFFCYFLSLQFVWIFALLDLKKNSESNSADTKSDIINETKNTLCPKSTQIDQKPFYTENDRPYGIKRFVDKILYSTCTCTTCGCPCEFYNQPVIRLLCLLYLTILFPFGLYRTLGRQTILGNMYNNYGTVVRPSEPIFEAMCKTLNDSCELKWDIVYATVFPFIYIIIGYISYKIFMTVNSKTCCCFPEIDEDEKVIRKSKGVSDRFAFRYYQLCMILSKEGCKYDRLKCDYCTCFDDCNIFCRCSVLFCTFIFSFIFCLFPIIPFSFCTHIAYCYFPVCKSCYRQNYDKRETDNYEELRDKASESYNEKDNGNVNENSDIRSGRADTEKKDNTKNGCQTCILWLIMQVFGILLTYVLCLRPIISTFTFLFRSFTYFVFVALPIRAHILRYTILIVTTLTYFVKYFHEIVNMNADILKHLFTCEGETPNNDNTKKISNDSIRVIEEEMFDFVYKRLMFVRKKLYFMFLKMIVVFMYLFITIETFITNNSSLTGSSFKDMLEFLLIIIGPYAISLFLKVNKEDFLTEENKTEIKHEYDYYIMSDKKVDNKTKEKTQESSTYQNQSPSTDGESARTSLSADANADDQNNTLIVL